jgi:hypothetical protein
LRRAVRTNPDSLDHEYGVGSGGASGGVIGEGPAPGCQIPIVRGGLEGETLSSARAWKRLPLKNVSATAETPPARARRR